MKYQDIVYYHDENDEVFNTGNRQVIGSDYVYIHKNKLYRLFSFVVHKVFATPLAFIWFRLIKRVRYANKKVLKQVKTGYFVYGNHVDQFSDAFSPSLICGKKPHIIVNSVNVSIPVIGRFNRMCGALPLPDTIQSAKNFTTAISTVISKKNPVVIYPEARLWPYYTKIRSFDERSFRYPVNLNAPVFVFTTTFRRKRIGKKPKLVIYVDGPIYPNMCLDKADRQMKLRDEVYKIMVERAKNSNYEYVQYIKKE